MTAEVGVMNKHGIALAADSAGTISNANGKRKIFNHSEKLFCISNNSPVGLMTYQNANIAGIPWSVIIKEYRNNNILRQKKLEDHAQCFFVYLKSLSKISSIVEFEETYVQYLLSEHLRYIKNQVTQSALSQSLSIEDINIFVTLTSNEINQYSKMIDSFNYAEGFSDEDFNELRIKYSVKVEKIINDSRIFYVDGYIRTEEERMGIEEIRRLMLSSRDNFIVNFFKSLVKIDTRSLYYSGIIIAGYGDDDWLPKLRSYRVYGYLNNKLKYLFIESSEISVQKSAVVNAFAQNDMVFSYLQGIHPDYKKILDNYDLVFRQLSGSLLGMSHPDIIHLKSLHTNFVGKINGEINMSVMNLLNSIAELPKPELANMAENLVNLTSFKQRITMTDETVGGPIDVALITKSEGFVWIKRKYYFDSKINSHYFRR